MPPGQRRYEVQLSSKSGPIDVFLIQDPTTTTANSTENLMSNTVPNSANIHNRNNTTHFHAAEMLKPFDIPMDAFAFEMKADEGAADLYDGAVDVYSSVFGDRRI
jgi:hypothetical protein